MKEPIIVKKEAFQAIGVSVTTTNEKEASTEGKIPELWNRYFQEQMMHHIPNQQTKETLAFYSNYESDETGTYTFTIGMPVSSLKEVPENMTTLTIPAATYAVFTTRKGPVAEVVCEAWEYIWKWSKENKRAFTTDFELYDEKATDPTNVHVNTYLYV